MSKKDKKDRAEAEPEVAAETAADSAPLKESSFSVEAKIESIRASKLSDAEKEAYIKKLSGETDAVVTDRVPFTVYANVKKIPQGRRAGMSVYPKAKGVALATVAEWDEIFVGF